MGYFNKFALSALVLSGMALASSSSYAGLADRKMIDVDPTQQYASEFKGDPSYKEALLTIKPKVEALKKLHNIMYRLNVLHNQSRIYEMVFDQHRYTVEKLKENTRLNVMALEPFYENADVLWGAPRHLGGPGHEKYAAINENLDKDALAAGEMDDWHYFTKYVKKEMDDRIKTLKDEEIHGMKLGEKYFDNPDYIEHPSKTATDEIYSMTSNKRGELEEIDTVSEAVNAKAKLNKNTEDGPFAGNVSDADDSMEDLYLQWKAGNEVLKGLYADQHEWQNKSLDVKVKAAFPHWRDQKQQFYIDWVKYFSGIQQCYLDARGGSVPLEYYEKGWPLMPDLTDMAFQYENEEYLGKVFGDYKILFDKKYNELTGGNPPNCSIAFNTNVPKTYAPLPPWREDVFFAYVSLKGESGGNETPDVRRLFAKEDSWLRMGKGYEFDMWKSWLINSPSYTASAGSNIDNASKTRYYREPAAHWHELGQMLSGREDQVKASSSNGLNYPPYLSNGVYNYVKSFYQDDLKNPALPLNQNRIASWYEIMQEEQSLRKTRKSSKNALLRAQRELVNDIFDVTTKINKEFGVEEAGLDIHKVLAASGASERDIYTFYNGAAKIRGTLKTGPVATYGSSANKCEIDEYGVVKEGGYDYLEHNLNKDGCYRYWAFKDQAYKIVFNELDKIQQKILADADTNYSLKMVITKFAEKYPEQTSNPDHPTSILVNGVTNTTFAGNHYDKLGFLDWLELVKEDINANMVLSGGEPLLNNNGDELVLWPWNTREYLDKERGVPNPESFVKVKEYIATLVAEDSVREEQFIKSREDFYALTIPSIQNRGPETLTRVVAVNPSGAAVDLTVNKPFKYNGKTLTGPEVAKTPTDHCSGGKYSITPDGSAGCTEAEKNEFEGFHRKATGDYRYIDTHFVKAIPGDTYKFRSIGGPVYQGTMVKAVMPTYCPYGKDYYKKKAVDLLAQYFVNATGKAMSPCNKSKWLGNGGGVCDVGMIPTSYISSYDYSTGGGFGAGYYGIGPIASSLLLAPETTRLSAFNEAYANCKNREGRRVSIVNLKDKIEKIKVEIESYEEQIERLMNTIKSLKRQRSLPGDAESAAILEKKIKDAEERLKEVIEDMKKAKLRDELKRVEEKMVKEQDDLDDLIERLDLKFEL
ncbi:MAG: hypothetical protein GY804_05690 [Alphaproteobacteria bacterium]|nr:hypothetical protein [Alphaproteobacteria bacterium]